MKTITHIGASVKKYLAKAKSVDIAVALAKQKAIEILNTAPTDCEVRIVIGVDLPTPVETLQALKKTFGTKARVYLKKEFYHPKVYIFTLHDDTRVVLVGSANFTNSGLNDNVELSVEVADATVCDEIAQWFESIYASSEPITTSLIESYKPFYNQWHVPVEKRKKDYLKLAVTLDRYSEERRRMILELKELRISPSYPVLCSERSQTVKQLREALDMNNGFANIDLETFWKIKGLGNLSQVRRKYKKTFEKGVENGKLQKLFRMICDDSIPLAERLEMAVDGDYAIEGCGRNVITKVLVVHAPRKYVLWNSITDQYLKRTGIKFRRGASVGEKYQDLCNIFTNVIKEADIRDFAVLDGMLFEVIEGL